MIMIGPYGLLLRIEAPAHSQQTTQFEQSMIE